MVKPSWRKLWSHRTADKLLALGRWLWSVVGSVVKLWKPQRSCLSLLCELTDLWTQQREYRQDTSWTHIKKSVRPEDIAVTVPTYWFRVSHCSRLDTQSKNNGLLQKCCLFESILCWEVLLSRSPSVKEITFEALHLSNFYLKHHNSCLCCPFRYSLVTMF